MLKLADETVEVKGARSGAAGLRALIVDLNSFANFPTLAVGLLVGRLRQAGASVQLISPLDHDVPATTREHAESRLDHWQRRLHLSTNPNLMLVRNIARGARRWWIDRPHPRVVAETERALAQKPDVLLLSAYLQHYRSIVELGLVAERHGVPMIVGGPMFNLEPVTEAWRSIPGLTAIVGAEVEDDLPELVAAVARGGDLLRWPGVSLPTGERSRPAPPLRKLNGGVVPDFTDFPWARYRTPVVPIMASRGCQWSRCKFCSDVVSVSGRTFRARSPEDVLTEMQVQAERHGTRNFIFLDLKLNSSPRLMRGLATQVQSRIPGAEWIGTVHVDERKDNGLSRADLDAAVAAGMRRISFGLESGSQRLLDAMDKGSSVARNSQFIRDAHAAGLSIRCTMFKGYPGETADDLEATADFLEQHADLIDRIRFNDFSLPANTPIYDEMIAEPDSFAGFSEVRMVGVAARATYRNADGRSRDYRRAKKRVLQAVYEVNRRPVRQSAQVFDGLM